MLNVLPGDLIACEGTGPVADAIRTVSKRTHVAVIVTAVPAIVAESTMSSKQPDVETGRLTIGVQAHFLSEWLAALDGSAWLYRLNEPLTDAEAEAFARFIELEHRNKVGYDFAGVMGLGADRLLNSGLTIQPDFGHVFCSELAAMAYQSIGRMGADQQPWKMTPDDVCACPIFQPPTQIK
jgi:hypothetical protein